jgi:hypothetical protein
MTAIGPANWEEYERLQRRFWDVLRQTFIQVLETSTEPIDEYQASLSDSSPDEQLLALHDDPLDLAAILTGVTLTPEMISRYDRMFSETYSEQVVVNPPHPVDVVPPYWEDFVRRYGDNLVPPYWVEVPRHWDMPVGPEMFGFVPRTAVTLLLERLGYSQVGRQGQLAVWLLSDDRFRGLPEAVLIPRPTMSVAQTGERGYDMRSVLNLYNWIIWLANRRGASTEILRTLVDQREQFARGLE